MKNPCIASIFMRNIQKETIELHRKVVDKFNISKIPFYHVLTDISPGETLSQLTSMLEEKGHDGIMFLDIDCIPLNDTAIDDMFEIASGGILVGDAQRSNHIENNQHVFVAPHNITFSIETYNKLGRPSFLPNYRGDVAEELTYKAREVDVPLEIIMPLRFDAEPIRFEWEKNSPPYWPLADGMPVYGIGTTFGTIANENTTEEDLFWHCYQIFHPGQEQRFHTKCNEVLK